MKKKLCRRCCVPLRVPTRTLTDATLCGYSSGFSNCIKGLWTRRCRLRSHILVSHKGELFTLRMSNLIRFKVGFADNRAHPDRTSSASQGARLLHLLLQAFLYVLHLFSMSKFNFSEQAGVEPAPPGEKH